MAVRGAGSSRRSHTKSRKGCQTCKRRHIRCDETFPQCRNCTKHQVRCDYQDVASLGPIEDKTSPESLTISTHESTEDLSQSSSSTSYYRQHLITIQDTLLAKGVSDLTTWTGLVSRLAVLCDSNPFVLDAMCSFSASNLAWNTQSSELRKLSMEFGSNALRGLHAAIGSFSKQNADAALAASLVLVSQATDWRTWSSLETGIRSVISAMESWKDESMFRDLIQQRAQRERSLDNVRRLSGVESHSIILSNIISSLLQFRQQLTQRQLDLSCIDQVIDYIHKLQASNTAQGPEEQFNQLYILRKWLFWVPVRIMMDMPVDITSLLIVANLYATAVALEPLFPDIGVRFCIDRAAECLEETLWRITEISTNHQLFQYAEIDAFTQFPTNALNIYRAQYPRPQDQQPLHHTNTPTIPMFDFDAALINSPGNMSPFFIPARPDSSFSLRNDSTQSPFLEVPASNYGFAYNTSQWGSVPSPSFAPGDFGQDSFLYDFEDDVPVTTFGGFVQPTEIWT